MPRADNADTSSLNSKRAYRKGKPMSASERQLAAIARKRETHKEVKVFIKNPLKDLMVEICEKEGITQAQFIENLVEMRLAELGVLDVKTSQS
ncbi:replication regulatory protein RepA [Ewingella americana]|jgi:hypothetical protein|uniref:replication regulatory protein RepA n=1 Tax=Ewingella americana TaxID=41202 RepID=UPI0016399321|nr:replication regulatory protein RepA [Ewingella americana]QMV54202.1 replication regulatory protein RepA [Ewingella americana]